MFVSKEFTHRIDTTSFCIIVSEKVYTKITYYFHDETHSLIQETPFTSKIQFILRIYIDYIGYAIQNLGGAIELCYRIKVCYTSLSLHILAFYQLRLSSYIIRLQLQFYTYVMTCLIIVWWSINTFSQHLAFFQKKK